MDSTTFVGIIETLHHDHSDRSALRSFGLKHASLCSKPLELLSAWYREHPGTRRWPSLWRRWLYRFSLWLYAAMFLFGFLGAMGLLHYNGKAPVNVIYFLFFAFFLPAVTTVMGAVALIKAKRFDNPFLHVGLTYLIERMTLRQTSEAFAVLRSYEERLFDWVALVKMQAAALWFALGLLVGLLATVVTQDIAFAWSTTLSISSERFAEWLRLFSLPWHTLWPEAVPSSDLIAHSRYFRLGGHIDRTLIAQAQELGQWWKFLVATVLAYTVLPRVVLYVAARWRIGRLLDASALRSAASVIEAICSPLAQTVTDTSETIRLPKSNASALPLCDKQDRYDAVVGLGMKEDELQSYADMFGIQASRYVTIGGTHRLHEDHEALAQLHGQCALIINAWEVPTFEAIDTIAQLAKHASRTTLFFVGTPKQHYRPDDDDTAIWQMKLETLAKGDLCLAR